jgi:hypothetical protein
MIYMKEKEGSPQNRASRKATQVRKVAKMKMVA